jgi:hypothetical protein
MEMHGYTRRTYATENDAWNAVSYIMKNTFSSLLSVTWPKRSNRIELLIEERTLFIAAEMSSCYVTENRLIHKQFKYN